MSTSDLLYALWMFSTPFRALVVLLAGFVVGLASWVLVRRWDPLWSIVAIGPIVGATLFGETRDYAHLWERMSAAMEVTGLLWLLLSVIWSAAVLVQPAGKGESRPAADRLRLLRWFLPTCVPIALAGAVLVLIGVEEYAGLFGLPLMISACLSLYDTERVRHVRRSVAWLQLSAAVAFVAIRVPHLSWLSLAGWLPHSLRTDPSSWSVLVVCGCGAVVPVVVLWVLGPRGREWRWGASLVVVCCLPGLWRAEWVTRTERALLHLDLSDLPTRAFGSWLLPERPRCIETPSSRCPEGVEPLWVWPADVPIGDRILGRKGDLLFRGDGLLSTLTLGWPRQQAGPAVVRLGEGSYRVAGKRVEGLQDALSAIEEARTVCGGLLVIEPDPGWTAQELVTLCSGYCFYESSPESCEQDEVLGWITHCEPEKICAIVNGTLGICEQGGCIMRAGSESNDLPSEPLRVSCDAGGCAVSGDWLAVELSCCGGGCTVSAETVPPIVTTLYDEGGCTPRP